MHDEFPPVFLDAKAASLEAYKELNRRYERDLREIRKRQDEAALLSHELSRATLPKEAEVRFTHDEWRSVVVIDNLESFDDVTEVLAVLDQHLPSWSTRPEHIDYVGDNPQRTWSYRAGTLGYVTVSATLGKAVQKCKVVKREIRRYIEAQNITDTEVEVICPSDPRYYEV
jgi:ribosomal protein L36